MATQRWYLTNGVDANGWQALSTTAQTAADTAAGWLHGTGATFSSELQANAERSAGFTANTVPDGTLDTSLKDAFRIPVAINGTFASANWTFQFTVVSPTQSGAADGQIVFRLIKALADGSSATEITSAQQSASVVTNVGSTDLGTSANVGTLTFNPGAITLAANQFLFIQIAWKRTGAGGMTTTNIRFRTGSSATVGTSILSADFTPANQAVTTLNIAATSGVNAPTRLLDVPVATVVSTASARGSRAVVFPSQFIGYCFYVDSGGVFGYSKTTDGGDSWGAHVDVDGVAATTVVAFDIWFDQWTPGDSGTLIHCWWFDSTNNIVRWRTLNITGDALGTVRTVFTGASAVAGRGAFVSGTKTRSGYLYCAYDIDAGAERGLHRSTDSGTSWSTNLATTFIEATLDTCKLFPASGTGDNNDCWALYYDASALALTLKLWDSSAVAQVESATIGVAHTDGATDLTGQYGFDAAVRHTDGHLIVAALSQRDVAASAHQVFDCASTSSITTLTAIAASTDDHYFPQVFINQGTGTIFVAYNGKRDGSEVLDTTTKVYYTYSQNGGTTWNAGDAVYMEDAAGPVQQVWTPMSGSRFYVVWRTGTAIYGNKTNSLIQLGSQLPTIDATSVVNAPTVVPGPVTVVEMFIASTASLFLPTVAIAAIPAQDVIGAFIGGGGGPSGPVGAERLITQLVSYWKFDEPVGHAHDAHGNNILADATTVGSAAGRVLGARSFASDYLTRPSNLDLQILNLATSYTFSCWVKTNSIVPVAQTIFAKRTTTGLNESLEYLLRLQYGVPYWYWGDVGVTGYGFVNAPAAVATGTWVFLVCGFNAATGKFFLSVDGAAIIESAAITTQELNKANDFYVGACFTAEYFDGLIDELGFWKRALTSTEITALYNSGAGLSYDSFGGKDTLLQQLQAFWKFDETSDTANALDAHGSTPLTVAGSPDVNTGGVLGNCRILSDTPNYFYGYSQDITMGQGYGTGASHTDVPFTISCWVFLTDTAKSIAHVVYSKFRNDPPTATEETEYELVAGAAADDRFYFIVADGSGFSPTFAIVYSTSLGTTPVGCWLHIVCWHDPVANLIGMQVNKGAPLGPTLGSPDLASWDGGTQGGTNPLYMGRQMNVTNDLHGAVDEMGLWKRVLSASERQALFNDGNALSYDTFGESHTLPRYSDGLLAGLVSYWKLDEASGSAAFDAHGITPLGDTNICTSGTGKLGTGRHVSTDYQYLSCSFSQVSVADIDFTFSCWVKFDSLAPTGNGRTVLSKYEVSDPQRSFLLYMDDVGHQLAWYVSGDGATISTGAFWGAAVSTGVWYHVVCWHDATADLIGISVNGGTPVTVAHSAGVFDSTAPFALGTLFSGGSPVNFFALDGTIDEVGFWKRLLTPTERTALYNSGSGLSYDSFTGTVVSGSGGGVTLFAPTVVPEVPQTVLGAFIGGGGLFASLESYWKLDEASGNAIDAHGTNTLTPVNGPGSGTGKINGARSFVSAATQYLTHATNASLDTGDIDFTVSFWVKFDSTGAFDFFVSKDAESGGNLTREWGVYYVPTDGHIYFFVFTPGSSLTQVPDTSFAASTGTWYHVVGWHDAGANQIGLVINGGTPNIASHSGGVRTGTAGFAIGAQSNGSWPHNGQVDEVGFWKRMLTSDERAALYNGGSGLAYDTFGSGSSMIFAPTVANATTGPQTILGAFIPGPLGTLLTALAGYWAFDEATNTYAYDSYATGTLNYGGNPAAVTGKVGGARQLSLGNFFQLMYPSNIPLTLGSASPFTISAWVYLTDKSFDRTIMAKFTTAPVTNTNQFEYWLHYNSGADRFVIIVGNGTTFNYQYASTFGSPPLNTWLHVVCWNDPTGFRLGIQVNGIPDSVGATGFTQGSTNFVYFGAEITSGDYWIGNIDETAFWNRVLTAGERTALWNNGAGLSYAAISAAGVRGVFPLTVLPVFDQTIVGAFITGPSLRSSLVSYWSMEDAAGAMALDAHGTNDLTDVGDFSLPGSATGKVGNARDFESSIYCLLIHSDNASLSTGDIDFTFSVWAKFETLTVGSEALIAKDNNGSAREYGLWFWFVEGRPFDQNTMIFWVFQPDGTQVAVASAGFSPVVDTWYHFIGWHDAVNNQIGIVVNAGTPSVAAHAGGVKNGGADFTIGAWGDGNVRMDGLIDEVGFWKRVLSSDERAYLYNSGSGRSYAALNTSVSGGSSVAFGPTVAPVAPSTQTITGAFIGAGTLRTGLTSYWKLDEGGGRAALDAHGGNILTDVNNVGSVAGKVGLARQFNSAIGRYFSVPDNAGLSAGDRDFTIAGWVYFDSIPTTNDGIIFAKDARTTGQVEYWFGYSPSDAHLVFHASQSGLGSGMYAYGVPATGTWYHFVLVHDAANDLVTMVINGTPVTAGWSGGMFDTAAPFTVGAYGNGTGFHDGRIDDLGFWSRVLTSTERTALYNGGTGISYEEFGGTTMYAPSVATPTTQAIVGATITGPLLSELMSYWKFDETLSSQPPVDSHGTMNLQQAGSPGVPSGTAPAVIGKSRLLTNDGSEYFYKTAPVSNLTVSGMVPWTWSVWVKLTNKTSDRIVVGKWAVDPPSSNGHAEYQIGYNLANDRLYVNIGIGVGFNNRQLALSYGSPPTGVWTHILAWYDPNNLELCIQVNNGAVDSSTWSSGMQGSTNTAYFGINPSAPTAGLFGIIDEIGFWKRLLSSAERAALYSGGAGLSYTAFRGGVFAPTVSQVPSQSVVAAFIGGGTLRTSLVGYWKFDETSGDALDAHGANPLTVFGTIGTATGKVGNARDFESSLGNYKFTHADNATLSTGDIDFTLSFWIKLESLSGYPWVVAKDAGGANGEFGVYYDTGAGWLSFYVTTPIGGSGGVDYPSYTPVVGVWAHVVVWHDAVNNLLGIVVNDGTPNTVSHTGGVKDSTAPFVIGSGADGNPYDGLIDELGFWKRMLTSGERTALYNSGSGLRYEEFGGSVAFPLDVTPTGPPDQAVAGAFIGGTLRNGLTSYWKLDEASGTALDWQGNHPLTAVNAPGTASGKVGTARQFNSASSRYLSVADHADLSAGHLDFTMSGWMYFDSIVSFHVVASKWDPTAGNLEYSVHCDTSGAARIYFALRNGSPNIPATNAIVGLSFPPLSTWLHFVAWYDATLDQIGISVNGTVTTTSVPTNGQMDTAAPFTIGAYGDGSSPFDGRIDEVGLWRRVLTSTERLALYNSGSGLSLDGFSAAVVFAPTVAPVVAGAVTTTNIASTAQMFTPTVTTGSVTVVGGTVTSTTIVRALTVTPGAVTVGAATLATTAQVNVPTIAVGAVSVTTSGRATTIQVFAPVVSANVAGATIPVGSGLFTPSVALNITTGTITTTSLVRVPSVAPGAVTVTTPGLATTIQVFAPTVSTGPVTVIGPTCAATSQLFGPTIATGAVTVTTPGLATTAQLFTPLVTQGAVGIVGTTLASTVQLFAPSVAPGAITITGATLTSTAQVFAPRVAVMVFGATIPAGSGVFAPTVIQTVTTAFIATTAQLFTPTVVIFGVQAVTAGTVAVATVVNAPMITVAASAVSLPAIASTVQVFSPTVAPGVVTVTTPGRPTTQQLFAPTIATGPVTVIGATCATITLVFPPSLTAQVTTAFLGSTTVLFPPVVLPTGVIGGPTTPSALQMFAPTVTTGAVAVTGAHIVTGVVTFAPTLTAIVSTAHRASTLQLFGPTVTTGAVVVGGGTVAATSLSFAPSVSVGVVILTGGHVSSTALVFAPVLTPGLTVGFITSTATVFEPDVLAGATAVSTSFIVSTTNVYPPAVGTVEVCEHFAVEIETAMTWGVSVHTMEAVSLAAMTELDAGVQMDRQLDLTVNVETAVNLTAPLQMCEAL